MQIIQHQELGSSQSSITFSSIPQTYTDLYLVYSLRTNGNDDYWGLGINGSTSNFSLRSLFGTGSTTTSDSRSDGLVGNTANPNNYTASTFSSGALTIPNYTSTTAAKSLSNDAVTENNATEAKQRITAMLWNPGTQAAVTSLTLNAPSGLNFVQYSSATLYGINRYASSAAPKATGGIISFDAVNNKWVHAFTASGTFTPTTNLTNVEYLVVAGGGGGGGEYGGGGGAGGYRSSVVGESSGGGASAESRLSLTSGVGYTVTVGAGGAGGASLSAGTSGANSVFSTITSTGGGGGGANNDGVTGGSGGGAGVIGAASGTRFGGSGTSNQGYAGGDSVRTASTLGGGGGGGAGQVGQSSTTGYKAGNGGNGVSSSITGSAVTRAGGGGGIAFPPSGAGIGGSGGGGNGGIVDSPAAAPTRGLANFGAGGGAGGGSASTSGANGGSGIVIVRYDA